jgi:hypothetical protein
VSTGLLSDAALSTRLLPDGSSSVSVRWLLARDGSSRSSSCVHCVLWRLLTAEEKALAPACMQGGWCDRLSKGGAGRTCTGTEDELAASADPDATAISASCSFSSRVRVLVTQSSRVAGGFGASFPLAGLSAAPGPDCFAALSKAACAPVPHAFLNASRRSASDTDVAPCRMGCCKPARRVNGGKQRAACACACLGVVRSS